MPRIKDRPPRVREVPNKPIGERRSDRRERDTEMLDHLQDRVVDNYNKKLEDMYGPLGNKKK